MSDLVYFHKSKLDAFADRINEKCGGGVEPISLDEMVAKAEDIRLIEMLESKTTLSYAFIQCQSNYCPLFKVNPQVTSVYQMFMNSQIKEIPELDFNNITNMGFFATHSKVEKIKIKNTGKVNNVELAFYNLHKCQEISLLDFTSVTNANNTFNYSPSIKELRFVKNSIHISISFESQGLLSTESVQSIIDGLATVTTAQTITFHKDIALTDAQKQTINEKGWTLVQPER